jgi:hypothetical protein
MPSSKLGAYMHAKKNMHGNRSDGEQVRRQGNGRALRQWQFERNPLLIKKQHCEERQREMNDAAAVSR